MEKIKYAPLVQYLRENQDSYNLLCRAHELHFGPLDSKIISSWMLKVIEPVIIEIDALFPERIPVVFKAFFSELLRILGNKTGVIFEEEYMAAWKLLKRIPSIVVTNPSRSVRAIDSGIEAIRFFQPDKVLLWISRMDKVIGNCDTFDEMLTLGRVYAWGAGMAHLRSRVINELSFLPKFQEDVFSKDISLKNALKYEWPDYKKITFAGESGGFLGNGGYFLSSPVVALIENEILVTDGKVTCAFFADQFGQVLLPEIPVLPEIIFQKADVSSFASFKKEHGESIVPFEDITSCVIRNSTLVITRRSSHYLYVYGWSA
ncbi:hypothetical protein [Sporocytophaga myxococcoides]|uniref:hypothetical protein n=1 Tax=Sporocytophaga myxococcoides TaxID=153721 RepID=UPI00048FD15C|nr:hypothetical protein [Sporocytophaga myxococcoides]